MKLTIGDGAFFNEFLGGLTLGDAEAFTLRQTANFAGGIADSFSLFILDPESSQALVTTDLPGDALAIIPFVDTPTPDVFIGSSVVVTRVTQEQLAAKAGLPQSHISRLEGAKHSPSRATLEKIAAALEVPLSCLDPSA